MNDQNLQSLILMFKDSKIHLSSKRLDDVINHDLKNHNSVIKTGSPWGTFADLLINSEKNQLVGLTFEANDAYKLQANDVAKSLDCFFIRYVDNSEKLRPSIYPAINAESGYLEITWSSTVADRFALAQTDYAVFGYNKGSKYPSWIGIDCLSDLLKNYQLHF